MKRQNANIFENNGLIFLAESLVFLELPRRIPGPSETALHGPAMTGLAL